MVNVCINMVKKTNGSTWFSGFADDFIMLMQCIPFAHIKVINNQLIARTQPYQDGHSKTSPTSLIITWNINIEIIQ